MLWDANGNSQAFSRCYSEIWVERLFAGVARNLTAPFRFVCFVDRPREFSSGIEQEQLATADPTYGCCIEPFRLPGPLMIMGLDTVIVGNIDALADHCEVAEVVALPPDPYCPTQACNGVALVPRGQEGIFRDWRGENDMEWLRGQPHAFIEDLFPGEVVSFKGHVRTFGLGDARIVYFHGMQKPHELQDLPWIREHWGVA